MKKQTKRIFSFLLCFSMIFSMLLNYIPVYANEGKAELKFSASNLEHGKIFCKIGENERIQIDKQKADGGGIIWIHDIDANEQNVIISVEPDEGYELRGICAYEGEDEGAGAAFNADFDKENGTYAFPLRAFTYVVDVNIQEKSGSSEVDPGHNPGDENGTASMMFRANDLNDLEITYLIELPENVEIPGDDENIYNEEVTVDGGQADAGGSVWVRNFITSSRVTITAKLKDGVEGTISDKIDRIYATEGVAGDAPSAADGFYGINEDGTGSYFFDANAGTEYAVRVNYAGEVKPNPGDENGTASMKFRADDLNDLEITYLIELPENIEIPGDDENIYNEEVVVDGGQADEGGSVWVRNFITSSRVTITAKLKDGVEGTLSDRIDRIYATEGDEDDAPSAADGFYGINEDGTGSYFFDANAGIDYVVRVNYAGEGNPGHEPGDEVGSWNQQYDEFISEGFNIVSRWIGNSQGDISYQFSNDDSLKSESWSEAVTITREDMEELLNTITSEEASEEAKAEAKEQLFGQKLTGKYVRILAGQDAGGDKLGFDIYSQDKDGNYHFDSGKTNNLKYYNYSTKEWNYFDNQNFQWEEYLKGRGFHDQFTNTDYYLGEGLIIDLSAIDVEAGDGFYCHVPFDSRLNISWWNEKYRGEVAAAGDNTAQDAWVENGMVELIRVASEDDTEVYYSAEEGWEADSDLDPSLVVMLGKAGYDWGGFLREGYSGPRGNYTAEQMLEAAEKASGQCNVPKGSIVTVKLTPDPGYQILTAQINGMDLTPDEGTQSQFSFKINSNIHFKALFEETKDVVDVTASDEVSEAVVEGANEVIDAGNVALIVEDDVEYDTTDALEQVDGDVVAAVDVAVEQIVAKAGNLSEEDQKLAKAGALAVTEDNYWTTPLSELENDLSISLTLDDVSIANGEKLSLVRDHDGECQVIPVEVSTKDGKVVATFKSDKFSTYTFVKTGAPVHTHSVSTAWTTDGTNHWNKCSGCAEKFNVAAHSLKTTTVTKANAEKSTDGKTETKCSVCGYVSKTTTISYPNTITLSATSCTYDGKEHKPTVKSVVGKDGKTIAATNYTVSIVNSAKSATVTPKAAGTYYVKVVFKGNYTGTKYITYKVNPKTGNTASISYTSKAYTGSALKPTVTVKNASGTALKSGTDYTVAYLNAAGSVVTPTAVGTYTVKVTMKGNYGGTITKTYKIVPKTTTIGTPVIAADGITVKWTKNTTGAGYYVYRSVNGASYTKVKTITSNATVSWKDTGAKTNGNKYQYKIVAYKTVSSTTYTSAASAIKTIYFVSKPTISSLTNSAAGKMLLKWARNAKASGYEIQYSTSSSFSGAKSVTATGTSSTLSKTIASLTKGKTYYVRIRSYKTVSNVKYYSVWSATKSVKITK